MCIFIFSQITRIEHEDVNHLNSHITNEETKTIIKSLWLKNKFRARWSNSRILRHSKMIDSQSFLNCFKNQKQKEHSNSVKPLSLLYPMQGRQNKKGQLQVHISDEHGLKMLSKILFNRMQTYIKKSIHYEPIGFAPKIDGSTYKSQINVMGYINRLKDKNYMIISIDEGGK